jgi:hypothetical protein
MNLKLIGHEEAQKAQKVSSKISRWFSTARRSRGLSFVLLVPLRGHLIFAAMRPFAR